MTGERRGRRVKADEIVDCLIENGPMSAQEISVEVDEYLGQVITTLKQSDKFVHDDRYRWHLTNESRRLRET